jgi:hypothetical protein
MSRRCGSFVDAGEVEASVCVRSGPPQGAGRIAANSEPTTVKDLRKGPRRPILRSSTEDDLDNLVWFIAFEANHAEDRRRQRRLDQVIGKLEGALRTFG